MTLMWIHTDVRLIHRCIVVDINYHACYFCIPVDMHFDHTVRYAFVKKYCLHVHLVNCLRIDNPITCTSLNGCTSYCLTYGQVSPEWVNNVLSVTHHFELNHLLQSHSTFKPENFACLDECVTFFRTECLVYCNNLHTFVCFGSSFHLVKVLVRTDLVRLKIIFLMLVNQIYTHRTYSFFVFSSKRCTYCFYY